MTDAPDVVHPPRPFDVRDDEVALLLDNSTYFSVRQSLAGGGLDAELVYNLASFAECLVFSDRLVTAPTLAWRPTAADPLFMGKAVCQQYSLDALTDADLKAVFATAISESRQDLSSAERQDPSPAPDPVDAPYALDDATRANAAALLTGWARSAAEDPRHFVNTYSGAVFLTDEGSRKVIASIDTDVRESADPARHLAQYLLRTNVALELTRAHQGALPYHPHSHRAPLVVRKLVRLRRAASSLAGELARAAEAEVRTQVAELRSSLLARFGAFAELDADVPLILGTVLLDAKEPSDVITGALALRSSRQARHYRAWCGAMLNAATSGDFEAQQRATREVEEARQMLASEVRKLYGLRPESALGRLAGFAGAVDVEKLLAANARSIGLDVMKALLANREAGPGFLLRFKLRPKVAFLTKLARDRSQVTQLNALLARVFGKGLPEDELRRLARLRRVHERAMAQLTAMDPHLPGLPR